MADAIPVRPDNIEVLFAELPRLARLALTYAAKLRRGTLDITLIDGRVIRVGGLEPGPAAAMTLHSYSFASRLINGGDIGIAEAYLNGEWDTPDLTQFLYVFCVNHELIQTMLGDKPLLRFLQIVRHWFNRNTRRQARHNIHAHYDIGNAFYSAWLDPSMTYSSALFEEHTPDLTAAQNNKYRRLAEAIDLRPGQKVRPRKGQSTWGWPEHNPEYLAFSKICTHAGCPASLYEQQTGRLLCPCHQSQFQVLHDAAPVFGPATRSLPKLPITVQVGSDWRQYFYARSDYREAIGPGFWERP